MIKILIEQRIIAPVRHVILVKLTLLFVYALTNDTAVCSGFIGLLLTRGRDMCGGLCPEG